MNNEPTGNAPEKPIQNLQGRRDFLAGMAVLGGAAALAKAAAPELLVPKNSLAKSDATTAPSRTIVDRGKVGDITDVRSEIKEYRDPKTGARILQLTSNGSNNVHPYFTTEGFIGDDSKNAIFISDRSGSYQWYMLDIPKGKLVQLTAGRDCGTNLCAVSCAGKLFYWDHLTLRYLNLSTFEDHALTRVPDGFGVAIPHCTPDGHFVTYSYSQKGPTSTASNVIYSTMMETYYQHPRSVAMRIDTAAAIGGATAMACYGDNQWYSHTLIHPTKPNIILFVHEGGHLTVHQRMWTVDCDQKVSRQAKPLYIQQLGDSCVHEFFTRAGEVGFQYTIVKDDGSMEEFNAFIRADGTWIRQYRYPDRRPGHFQSNSDNSLCIGDCAYFNPKDDDGDKYLGLMTHGNGIVNIKRLAWHGTSWKTQESHPHPVFSPDDRYVMYNSDAQGKYNVYLADVQSV